MAQHRDAGEGGFASRYAVYRLVHVEYYGTMEQAIAREKQLKKWNRDWKLRLIEQQNPDWRDLTDNL